jgi:two-component system chemotaxis response regulator CheB
MESKEGVFMKKKILIIDDSALMRRLLSDIINSTSEYQVGYTASDGVKGLSIIEKSLDDITAVISDINMPNMSGLELLGEIRRRKIDLPFIIFSSNDDVSDTLTALDLGAIEFIKKPERVFGQGDKEYEAKVLRALNIAASVREKRRAHAGIKSVHQDVRYVKQNREKILTKNPKRLVAICCSTGGPRALQFVLPKLPENLATPVTLVQHMPAGFTNSLASRLNDLSKISVVEANEGDRLKPGVCYIAKGGTHLTVDADRSGNYIKFDDSPPVVGLKPCGNIMFDSLAKSSYDEIVCVILTGMGADGTKGILELAKHKKVYVIAQDEESSTVYGMPKAIYEKGVVDVVCSIEDVADEITKKVGVR